MKTLCEKHGIDKKTFAKAQNYKKKKKRTHEKSVHREVKENQMIGLDDCVMKINWVSVSEDKGQGHDHPSHCCDQKDRHGI